MNLDRTTGSVGRCERNELRILTEDSDWVFFDGKMELKDGGERSEEIYIKWEVGG